MKFSLMAYYLKFVYYRLRLFSECSKGTLSFLISEFVHLLSALHIPIEMPTKDKIVSATTIWGKFRFIGDLYGHIIIHPAFERQDKEVLLKMMRSSSAQYNKVLFLDVGAFVGDYMISLSNNLHNAKISYLAFEPDEDYFRLLKENAVANSVRNLKIYNYGLSRKSSTVRVDRFPGDPTTRKLYFKLRTLDSLTPIAYFKKFDEIFIKIDIEGHEIDCFEGAGNLIKSGRKITMLIEDYLDPSLKEYLVSKGFRCVQKVSPYNSFWQSAHEKH